MPQEIFKHRSSLKNTLRAMDMGQVTIGFIGGSITDERPGHNWPEAVVAWFVKRFPNVRFIIENAAIGATGSDFAVLRAERDLIARGCDLVFVEYAVNDNETPAEKRIRTREGLLRKLLKNGSIDVILTYTYCQDMYDQMNQGEVPASIEEFERLAEHYQLGSVWMGLYAFEEVKNGQLKWEEWLPDGLHPTYRGSYSYAQSVCKFLEDEFVSSPSATNITTLPKPINPNNWEAVELLPFEEIQLKGPWSVRRSVRSTWADQILETNAIGASLQFSFYGNGLILTFDFGRKSSEFRYRIDEGDMQTVHRDRPDWIGDSGWLRSELLTEDLATELHTIEIEVIHGNREGCEGTNFRLTHIGIIK